MSSTSNISIYSTYIIIFICYRNNTAAHVAMRKLAVSLTDSQDLRVILSVLYIITEVMRAEKASESTENQKLIDTFCYELGEFIIFIKLLIEFKKCDVGIYYKLIVFIFIIYCYMQIIKKHKKLT